MHHRSHDWGVCIGGGAYTPLQVVRILLECILVNRLILVGSSHTEGKVLVNSQTFPVFCHFFQGMKPQIMHFLLLMRLKSRAR